MRQINSKRDLNHYKEELTPIDSNSIRSAEYTFVDSEHSSIQVLSNRHHRVYYDLIEDGFHDDLFRLLDSSIEADNDLVAKKSKIKIILSDIFSLKHINVWFEKKQLEALSSSLVLWCKNSSIPEIKQTIKASITKESSSVIFSKLLLARDIESAVFFRELADNDLSKYTRTICDLINFNMIEELDYILRTSNNIYYDNNYLLNSSVNNEKAALLLIDKFNFNINAISSGTSFISKIVDSGNIDLFKQIIEKYSDKIDFNDDSFFLSVKNNKRFDFFSILLKGNHLKTPQVKKIYELIFSAELIEGLAYTSIYSDLFNNPKFDYQIMNLGQGYFIYGLLSKLGILSKKSSQESGKCYVHILDDYLNSIKEQFMPDSPDFHVLGAAIHVANICHNQPTIDSLTLVLRKFPNYINKVNPNGQYPLQQVSQGSAISQILINNGASLNSSSSSIWGYLKSFFSKKSTSLDVATIPMENDTIVHQNFSLATQSIRQEIRNDFKIIQEIISSDNFDFEIKVKSENLFLLTDKLSIIIENHPEIDFRTELHFISQNFANYLLKSLKAYSKFSKSSLNNDDTEIKKITLNHISMLTDQINLMLENCLGSIKEEGIKELEIRTKFLESKFGG